MDSFYQGGTGIDLRQNKRSAGVITRHPFKLETPNFDKVYKIAWLRFLLFFGTIEIDLQCQI